MNLILKNLELNKDYTIKIVREPAHIFIPEGCTFVNRRKAIVTIINYAKYDLTDIKEDYDEVFLKGHILFNCQTIIDDKDLYIITKKITVL